MVEHVTENHGVGGSIPSLGTSREPRAAAFVDLAPMTAEASPCDEGDGAMKVTFYGKLASLLGRELELDCETPCTVAGLRNAIAVHFPMPPDPSTIDGCAPASASTRSPTIIR